MSGLAVVFNNAREVTTLLHYLEKNEGVELLNAIEAAKALHKRDPWLSPRERELLNLPYRPASPSTVIRAVLRQIAAHYLDFTQKEMGRKYREELDIIGRAKRFPELCLDEFPKPDQLTGYWSHLQDQRDLLRVLAQTRDLEARRRHHQEAHPEFFDDPELVGLSLDQCALLKQPITLERLLHGHPSTVWSALIDRLDQAVERLGALDWEDLNEKATDFLEEFPAFVEASTDGSIPILLRGLYTDTPLNEVKRFSETLQQARKNAEGYMQKIGGLGAKGQSLAQWAAATAATAA